MNIISKRTIVKFYTIHPQSKTPLEVWYADAKDSIWKTPNDVKKVYASASFLEDNRIVFNIKGNDYRLIVHVDYLRKFVRIKFIGTHGEYDKINAKEVKL
ncbi:type II toxin-antitoxin system HigB family toxin [Poseidonibacter ostreae]|uniref:Type II toxin-antitoxin system HigB family toxin n=1 Tax=Poseidonibacter ostreae TaxID=2654171 RepID=A0A6L4WWY2_9BACT|nr:type II toxin-antitoxin system HigB family toxin [Poseidonibacter ostreae]KAB7891355.1 type II toxin-antitoxin system HigB family toxin [Poseidonibacter ostreae]